MRTCLRAPLAVALVVLSWSHLSAQNPPAKQQFMDQQPVLDIKAESAVKAYLKGAATAGESNGSALLATVARKYMSEFTEVYNANDSKVPKFQNTRRKITELLSTATNAEARAALVKELTTIATSYAGNNQYLPAARINAVYILGDLDESVDTKAGTRKPHGPATMTLMNIAGTPNLPIFLKVAGLSALERHVRDGHKSWPEAAKQRVRNAVVPYAATKPKLDNDRMVNTWLTRRAIDILKIMDSNDAVDAALGYLADPKELPSLRTTALEYLVTRDFSKLDAAQRKLYVLGMIHYLRTRSTDWYQLEGDKAKRKGGAMAGMGEGGMGGMGGGMGGMGGGMGGMGGGFGDDGAGMGEGGMGGMGGGMGGMGGGMGGFGEGGGAGGSKPKAKDVQDWQTRSARSHLNEVTQLVHRALDGKRTVNEPANTSSKLHLTKEDVVFEEDYKLAKLIQLVDDYQKAINDIGKVRTVSSLMENSKKPIEEIMDFSKKTPGFLEKYPELKSDEDKLQEAEQPKVEGDGKEDGSKKDGGTDDPTKPGNDGGDKPKQ